MIRHIVLFKWTTEATEEQKAAVAAELSALPAVIPSVRAFLIGPDAGLAVGNFDFAVTADFEDEAGFFAYRDDLAHRDVINRTITPILGERFAVQIKL